MKPTLDEILPFYVGNVVRTKDGDKTIVRIWESRFGNWKASYDLPNGGGGVANVADMAKDIAQGKASLIR
jgi:hypothetical protein